MAALIEGTNPGGADAGPPPGQPAAEAQLVRLWHQWRETVEGIARREKTSRRIDPDEYRALQRKLLDTCRALARAPNNPRREFYERMEGLISPWVSLAALEQTDGEILSDLLFLCGQVDRQLGGRRWGATVVRVVAWVGLVLMAAGALTVARRFDGSLAPLWNWARGKVLEARWAVTRSDDGLWLLVGAFVVTMLAIYLVSRAARD